MQLEVVAALLLVACQLQQAAAASSGASAVPLCDAHSPLFGCDPANFVNDDRLNCSETGQLMNWAAKVRGAADRGVPGGMWGGCRQRPAPRKLMAASLFRRTARAN